MENLNGDLKLMDLTWWVGNVEPSLTLSSVSARFFLYFVLIRNTFSGATFER